MTNIDQIKLNIIKMRNKKGVIEIQFNWIFVLIAGALILTFFITLVVKQKTTSEISIKTKISTDLEAILTGAEISKGTVNVVDIPKTEIDFYCDRYAIGDIQGDIKGTIFAPSLIKGTKLITWSLGWNVPYRVTNFLYLTNPRVRYILVGTSSLAQQINLTIPDKINKEFYTTLDTVADKNNYKVKFVFFDTIETGDVDISSLSRMPNDDVTAIKVSADSNIDSGEMTFYKKQGSSWGAAEGSSYYLGKESLIGAIFSEYKDIEDEKVYDCVMQKAFKRLNLVTQVYTDRSEEIKDTITDITCISIHNSAYNDLNSVSSEADDLSKNFPSDPSNVADKMSSLKNLNENAQLYSCPLIY